MDESRRVCAVSEVPADTTLLVTVAEDDEEREVVLTRLDGEVVAYSNYCQHWTDVRIDKGDGALRRNGEMVCRKHGATFQLDTGVCDFGPCQGAVLPDVDVTVEDGAVYLADEALSFVRVGPAETDDGDGSSGRVDFTGA